MVEFPVDAQSESVVGLVGHGVADERVDAGDVVVFGQPRHVVQKPDQRTGNLTRGRVKDILTKSPFHPHGIKVRLESGIVGRVKTILPDAP